MTMSHKTFGNPAIFVIEVRPDLEKSNHLFVLGRFIYWIGGRPIGEDDYENLTDSFSNLGWVRRDCGQRDGGALCAVEPEVVRRWWWMIMTDAPREDLAFIGLPEDVARFNLMFDFGAPTEPIFLIACADRARLIWFPNDADQAMVTEDAIEVFEQPIRDAYAHIGALHDEVGFGSVSPVAR